MPDRVLASYAGDYRERTVPLRGGRLYYGGGVRPAAELVAIYRDGSVDRWSRR